MTSAELKRRTEAFAFRLIRLVDKLPQGRSADILGRQVLRSGTSVAANYRSACRARSRREFIAKLGIVEEEVDETALWLKLILRAGIAPDAELLGLVKEANELTAITVASIKTARAKMGRK